MLQSLATNGMSSYRDVQHLSLAEVRRPVDWRQVRGGASNGHRQQASHLSKPLFAGAPWRAATSPDLGGADAGPGLWAQGIEAALALLQHHRRWGIGESSTPAWLHGGFWDRADGLSLGTIPGLPRTPSSGHQSWPGVLMADSAPMATLWMGLRVDGQSGPWRSTALWLSGGWRSSSMPS